MTKALTLPEDFSSEFVWTLERYHRAIANGTFTEDDRIELLFGKIIEKMPIGAPHSECVTALLDYFYELYGAKYKYRTENPVTLPNNSEPEPDFVAVTRKKYGKEVGHPKPDDIFLLVEVAHNSQGRDRGSKATAYALAGIREYWIIDLDENTLTLCTNPIIKAGFFGKVLTYGRNEPFTSPFAGQTLVDSFLEEE